MADKQFTKWLRAYDVGVYEQAVTQQAELEAVALLTRQSQDKYAMITRKDAFLSMRDLTFDARSAGWRNWNKLDPVVDDRVLTDYLKSEGIKITRALAFELFIKGNRPAADTSCMSDVWAGYITDPIFNGIIQRPNASMTDWWHT